MAKRNRPSEVTDKEPKRHKPMSPLETLVTRIHSILLSKDENNHLSSPQDYTNLASLSDKLKDYTTLADYKNDLDDMFRSLLVTFPNPSSPIHQLSRQLFSFANHLIHAQVADMVVAGEQVGEFAPLQEPAKKSRSTRKSGEEMPDMFVGQAYSLVQKSANGSYFFSSPLHRYVDDISFDSHLPKLKIQPTLSTPLEDVPLLSSSAYALKRAHPAVKPVLKVKINPVKFPDYGLYSSFAPLVDTSIASLSRSESALIKLPSRRVILDPLPPSTLALVDGKVPIYNGAKTNYPQLILPITKKELNTLVPSTEFKREDTLSIPDLDVEALIHKLDGPVELLQDSAQSSTLLQRNAELLWQLNQFQLERVGSGTVSCNVSPSELQVALALQRNLLTLAKEYSPKELSDKLEIRKAIDCVKLTEKAFSGSLIPNAPFVFGCNSVGNGVIPTGAGTRLLYRD